VTLRAHTIIVHHGEQSDWVEKGNVWFIPDKARRCPTSQPPPGLNLQLILLAYSHLHTNMLTRLAFDVPRHVVPGARRTVFIQVPTPPRARCRALTVSAIRAQSILHGSKDAKEAGERESQNISRLIARGKYLHGIESVSFAQSRPTR
jgi:hypothetical protein